VREAASVREGRSQTLVAGHSATPTTTTETARGIVSAPVPTGVYNSPASPLTNSASRRGTSVVLSICRVAILGEVNERRSLWRPQSTIP
jgi:hypothetical protein